MIALIKSSLALSDPIHVTTALFYREDGTVDPTLVLVDEDSWKELAPYIHTLHVEDGLERPSTARSTLSTITTLSGTAVAVGNGTTSSSAGTGASRGLGLNSNATAFIPTSNGTSIKNSDGSKVNLQGLHKPSFSPSCGFCSPRLVVPC